MNYFRISILIFLGLKERVQKENFLNIIDNSLLHQDIQAKLESLIKYCDVVRSVCIG